MDLNVVQWHTRYRHWIEKTPHVRSWLVWSCLVSVLVAFLRPIPEGVQKCESIYKLGGEGEC